MHQSRQLKRRNQAGVVLILAIVVLVAMSLAAIALMRSTLTGNKVAGNLAFQQSATQSADVGVETAVSWLEQNRLGTTLQADLTRSGVGTKAYFSSRSDPTSTQSWSDWWDAQAANVKNPAKEDSSGNPVADAAGNTVQYIIQRLCRQSGDPTGNIGCETAPTADPGKGGSKGAGGGGPSGIAVQYYYRVTSRVTGARGTVSFVQVVVAM